MLVRQQKAAVRSAGGSLLPVEILVRPALVLLALLLLFLLEDVAEKLEEYGLHADPINCRRSSGS